MLLQGQLYKLITHASTRNVLPDELSAFNAKDNIGNCDGSRVNQALFKKFDTIEPWRTKENMFLLFDFVHLMKTVRNNWITEKTQELEFVKNGIKRVARWSDIKRLYQLV